MSNGNDLLTVTAVDPGNGDAGPAQAPGSVSPPAQLPPLAISALMVTKADLIAALRVYLPQISDIEMIDGERFLLSVGAPADANGAH